MIDGDLRRESQRVTQRRRDRRGPTLAVVDRSIDAAADEAMLTSHPRAGQRGVIARHIRRESHLYHAIEFTRDIAPRSTVIRGQLHVAIPFTRATVEAHMIEVTGAHQPTRRISGGNGETAHGHTGQTSVALIPVIPTVL